MSNLTSDKPTHAYELRANTEWGYVQLLVSLDKSLLEQFVEQVREHDKLYFKASQADDFDAYEYAVEHPLAKWAHELTDDALYASSLELHNALGDLVSETWASILEIVEIELFYE